MIAKSNHQAFKAMGLTEAERATNFETLLHIQNVQLWIQRVREDLDRRGAEHDASKLRPPELKMFVEATKRLAGMTYGTDEYQAELRRMNADGGALDHHYRKNRHHPEHFEEGVNGMTLVDLIELLCDWKAATLRHDNGDMGESLRINKKRFGLSDQLTQILLNTITWMGDSVVQDEARERGAHDAMMDAMENCPFASLGTSVVSSSPSFPLTLPSYIGPDDASAYIAGYLARLQPFGPPKPSLRQMYTRDVVMSLADWASGEEMFRGRPVDPVHIRGNQFRCASVDLQAVSAQKPTAEGLRAVDFRGYKTLVVIPDVGRYHLTATCVDSSQVDSHGVVHVHGMEGELDEILAEPGVDEPAQLGVWTPAVEIKPSDD